MSKGSAKKPKPAKSRGSGTPLEGRPWVRIGGARWLREDAEKAGKHMPKEYREGYVRPLSQKEKDAQAAAEAAAAAAEAAPESPEAVEASPEIEEAPDNLEEEDATEE